MRPIGSVLFGHIGDTYGRKIAITVATLMMAICTSLMGCLPTYADIGWVAPLLLVLLRLVQGLSAGGQFVGSLLYTVESAPPHQKAFFGSICVACKTVQLPTPACQPPPPPQPILLSA